ncbi:MAG: hypothetical protein GX572_06495 [Clostridia bacterium]|nr:hypothetical protein [Clostridia bacterium]
MPGLDADKDYLIFVGNFGSGKTELALHFAYAAAAAGLPTTLVDLDIINTYFRASEQQEALAAQGIRLITPGFAMANVELITINPQIYSVFAPGNGTVVFDVGGDQIGSRALGQYWNYFAKLPPSQLKVWLVINPQRPLSATPEQALAMLRQIEQSSRLLVTGLINNGNLSYESSNDDLIAGYEVVSRLSLKTGIPVVATSGEQEPLSGFLAYARERELDSRYIGEPLFIHPRIERNWRSLSKFGIKKTEGRSWQK